MRTNRRIEQRLAGWSSGSTRQQQHTVRGPLASLSFACLLLIALGQSNLLVADDAVVLASVGDPQTRQAAIAKLRREGPAGLDQIARYYKEFEQRSSAPPESEQRKRELQAIDYAIDQVGGALGSRSSGLYWHTDWAQAQAAARQSGRPILALHLLGKLTDEYSCANSRFFRATLYANQQVASYLRANYTLYWKTVCSAPRITIDFGEGRRIERTITGNSIHYVVDADGLVIDALPGLFGPESFLERVTAAAAAHAGLALIPQDQKLAVLTNYRLQELRNIAQRWISELNSLPPNAPPHQADAVVRINAVAAVQPYAAPGNKLVRATSTAPSPSPTSEPITFPSADEINTMSMTQLETFFHKLEQHTTEQYWERMAAKYAPKSKLDDASRGYIANQRPLAYAAGRLAITKSFVENPMLRLVRNLEHSIALDTVHNEFQLRRRFHAMLMTQTTMARDMGRLNEMVYAHLFLMPLSDPWLGLAPTDVYTGLPNNGVVQNPK